MGVILTTYIHWDGPRSGPSQIPMIFGHVSFSAPTRSSSRRPSARSNRSAKGGKVPYKRGSSFPPRSSRDVFFVSDLCCRDAAKHTKTRWFFLELCYVDTIFWEVTLRQMDLPTNCWFQGRRLKKCGPRISKVGCSLLTTHFWASLWINPSRCSLPNKHWDAHKSIFQSLYH